MNDINQLIENMSDQEKTLILSKILGYERVPVDIETFIMDDYYLGQSMRDSLYPFWLDELKKIFVSPVLTKYPYISLGGAIGVGKSTVSKIMTLYMLHRIDCLSNPWKTLGVAKTKSLAVVFQHTTAATAYKEFGKSIETMMEQSPYFNNMHHNHDIRFIYSGIRDQNMLGSDAIMLTLSEINFINPDIAKNKMDTAFGRFTSRFNKMRHYFGFIILDTSSKGDASVVENFLRDNAFGDDVISIKASQWEAKGSKFGGYWEHGSFKVYAGDAIHYPFIITDEEKEIDDTMDRDRILVCPMEVYPHFKQDIIKSLNDLAGYSVHSTGKYLPDPKNFFDCCKLPKLHPDVITVDFNDLNDKIMYKVKPAIDRIPRDAVIWISVDIGVVSDKTGISICYFDKWVYYGENKTPQPYFIAPLVVGISRIPGQETSILHIFDFIKELSETFEIGMVTADSFQSRQLFQDLTRLNIPTKYVSVDKTDTAYNILKSLFNRLLIEYPDNSLFKKEITELNHQDGKVDHPKTGSKDVADSLCQCITTCYENLELAQELSGSYRTKMQMKLLDGLNEDSGPKVQFQNMLNDIFR